MATPLAVSIPHRLGRAEARRRIETGFAKIIQMLPGAGACRERWDGDRLTFDVMAMGQSISGVVDVQDGAVTMEIRLPGLLGFFAGRLKDRLRKAGQLLLTKE